MPRYFFDIHDDVQALSDTEGEVCANPDEAGRRAAQTGAGQIWAASAAGAGSITAFARGVGMTAATAGSNTGSSTYSVTILRRRSTARRPELRRPCIPPPS